MVHPIDPSKTLGTPVEHAGQDEFNRAPFCIALADRIASLGNEKGAAVVSLYGKWGFGKTSMLNLIADHLQKHHGETVVVASFNPWLFTNEEALLKSFFEMVEPIANPKPGIRKALKVLSTKFGGHVGLGAELMLGSTIGKVLDTAVKNFAPTLREQNSALRETRLHTIVLLIDDLDRLDRAELLLMLKLVRLNSNLPNVVYLLAFDDEMVARSVGSANGMDVEAGREFLEKIVQFPFAVPAIGAERLLEYVLRHAREACSKAGVTVGQAGWRTFEKVCREGFTARLRTPRQAIRYGAAMEFSLPMLRGEVDPVQQMIVEGLRLLFPEPYVVLRDGMGAALASGRMELLYQSVLGATRGHEAAIKTILDALLKPSDPVDSAFAHPRYWQRYFEYAVRTDGIGNRDLAQLKHSSGEPAALAAECVRLLGRNPTEFSGIVRDLALGQDHVTRLRWIAALMNASASLPDIVSRPIWQELAELIALLVFDSNRLDPHDAEEDCPGDFAAHLEREGLQQVLTENCAPGLLPLLWRALEERNSLLRNERLANADFGPEPFDISVLRQIITGRLQLMAPEFLQDMLVKDSVGFDVFAHLRVYADESFRDWMASSLRATPDRAVDLLRHVTKAHGSQELKNQNWIDLAALAEILYARFGETVPQEPRHPLDKILAIRDKYQTVFAY